jgi:hypothetical protein
MCCPERRIRRAQAQLQVRLPSGRSEDPEVVVPNPFSCSLEDCRVARCPQSNYKIVWLPVFSFLYVWPCLDGIG